MGFSLKNLLEERVADINPFDKGKTAATVRAKRPAPPAQVPQRNQPKQQSFGQRAERAGLGIGLGALRSFTGLGQGVSGLYDLATPGKGTNRFSKKLDVVAKDVDATAKAEKINTGVYKGTQFGTDALTFLAGAGIAKAASKVPAVAKVTNPAAQVVKPVTRLIDSSATKLAGQGAKGRIAATTLRGATNPANNAANVAMTGLYTGADASKGRDISAGTVGVNLAAGTAFNVGLPLAGGVIKEGVKAATPGAVKTAKVVKDTVDPVGAQFNDHIATLQKSKAGKSKTAQKQIDKAIQATLKERDRISKKGGVGGEGLQLPKPSGDNIDPSLPQSPVPANQGKIPASSSKASIDPLESLKQEALKHKNAEELKRAVHNNSNAHKAGIDALREQSGITPEILAQRVLNGESATKIEDKIWQDLYKQAQPTQGAKGSKGQRSLTNPQTSANLPLETGVPSSPNPQPLKPTFSYDGVGTSKTSGKSKSQPQLGELLAPETQGNIATTGRKPSLANNTTLPEGMRERGLITSAKNSPEVSPTTQKAVSGEYQVRNTAELALEADKIVKKSLPKATVRTTTALGKKTGTMTDEEIAEAIAVAKTHDSKGTEAGLQKAQEIYERLAEHGTKGGQQIQAFTLLSNRTPEGMKHSAYRALKKAGIELDDAGRKTLDDHIKTIKKLPAGEERTMAIHDMIQFVHSHIPSTAGDKAVNFWRAGLLTMPTTTGGNIVGNSTEAITRNLWSNPVATVADLIMSGFTGKRTKTLTSGYGEGAKTGFKKGKTYLQTGFDERNPMEKYDGNRNVQYDNKFIDKYVNGVYRWMGGQDQPFYYAQQKQATRDLATADAKNLKLKGAERADYIAKAEADPNWKPTTFKTKNDQVRAGKYAVYQNETALGQAAMGLKKPLGAVGDFIVPFSRIPAAVAMRIIDRTPVGIAKEMVQQLHSRKFDQRALAEAIGDGSFGVGVVGAGYALSASGDITGAYPTDQKEAELWRLQGKQPYSVKVGNRWYSLNYMQPFGTLLSIGHQAHQDKQAGKTPQETIASATGAAARSVENQSFLQGINGLLSAVNDPERSLNKYVTNTASSVVPNFIRGSARAIDPMQREVKGVVEGVKSAIPGVRQSLPAKQDAFGRDLKDVDNPINQYLNPLRPSKSKTGDPIVSELQRLQDTQNGIIPTQFNKSSLGKDAPKLTNDQVRKLQAQVGSEVYKTWGAIMADPRYAQLSDPDKATILKQANDAINGAGKGTYRAENNMMGDKPIKYSAKEKALLTGSTPDFLAKSGASSNYTTSPDAQYKEALLAYNSEKSGYTDVQRIKKEKELNKLKVGSTFDKNVRDLYSLSKADAYAYLSSPEKGKDKAKMAEQLMAYDQALLEAGITKYRKYKNGLAPAAKKGRTARKGRKGGRGKSRVAKFEYDSTSIATNKSLRQLVKQAQVRAKKA